MPSIFKNPEHHKLFMEKGYIILEVVTKNIITELKELFDENFFHTGNPRSNFNAVSQEEKNNLIKNESIRLLADSFDKIFIEYNNKGATFFIKDKSHGELGLHQDTTIVDFRNHFACYAWIPLLNVTEENGCICVVEKSHLFFNNYISFTYKNENIPLNSISSNCVKKLEMRVGEVLFFDNRLFHGSFPNQTDALRVAINTLITSKNAPLVYYQKKDENIASEYFVTPASYLNSYRTFSKGLLPDGAVFSREIPYKHTNITPKVLNKTCSVYNKNGFSLFRPLNKIFGY